MRSASSVLAFALLAASCADAPGNEAARAPVATPAAGSLAGLYEGGQGARRNQLCLIERAGQPTRFGLIVWGDGDTNCSGVGRAERTAAGVRLTMEGDPSCAIDARTDGARIGLPDTLPAGCAYYCGPSASLAGAAFERSGTTDADASRAVDLVGDPLCAAAPPAP